VLSSPSFPPLRPRWGCEPLRALTVILSLMAAPAMAGDLTGTWRPGDVAAAFDAGMMERAVLEIAPDGAISGSGGCNRLTGRAESTATGQIAFTVGTTFMFCPGGVMPLERAFLDALQGARTYVITDDTLVLQGADGAELARLSRAE
jgi:Heat shock protein